jgi:recombination protein RecA
MSDITSAIISDINKHHGKGSAIALSDGGLSLHVPGVIPSGSAWLDWALGRGGWPLGRIVLVGGDEGTGKTTLGIMACASCQAMGGVAVYIDAEFKLDMDYADALGVDTDKLILMQPKYIEKALQMTERVINMVAAKRAATGKPVPILVVFDSISAIPAKAELDGDYDDLQVGLSARTMSKGLRKITGLVSSEAVCFMLISQLREKIGISFGDNTSTACGKAPRFHACTIVNLGRGKLVKDDGTSIGGGTHVYVHKNQVAPPHRKSELRIIYGEGISREHGIHGVATKCGWATLGGSWTKPPKSSGMKAWNGLRGLTDNRQGDLGAIETAIREHYETTEWDPTACGVTVVR